MGHRIGTPLRAAAIVALAAAGMLTTTAPGAAAAKRTTTLATISWASHGVPHISATSWRGLGYGYGYALASEDLCTIADAYVTVRAERSRYFGPDRSWTFRGNSTTANNLNSDFFFQRIKDAGTVEKLVAQPPPNGPRPEVRAAVRGYVQGYNRWLATHPGDHGTGDPLCRGKDWVTPITELDAYRRFYELALLASSGVAIDGIGGAMPPTPVPAGATPTGARAVGTVNDAVHTAMLAELKEKLPLGGIGSNAIALGKDATDNGRGMLLGNPHFPWDGSERFFQSQLTIPGKIDVAGGSLLGVPVILIGHNRNLAWSHTVSTAFRFTPYELKLVPGSPTTYLYDGKPTQMTSQKVTVMVPGAGGTLKPVSRTLYSTVWGPVVTTILNLGLFPWTPVNAYAMADANASNFRYLNHFFETDLAQSTDELYAVLKRNQGIPWVNTIAADSAGKAFYADISVTPNVPDDLTAQCSAALGLVTDKLLNLPILDGSRSDCRWRTDADAIQPGTFGPSHMPHLFRDDFVTNSNDSFWLSNPKQPLEGFAHIIGPERTPRSLRTRNGLEMVQARLDGSDGLGGPDVFSAKQLRDLVFNDRQEAGVLWRDPLVQMCRASGGTLLGTSGPVDVSGACPVLAAWDERDDLDSKGALLFRRFAEHLLISPVPLINPIYPWTVPFDAADPVHTPRGLSTDNPVVRAALADAVHDLRGAGAPLDAGLRGYQYEVRNGEKLPIPGGPGTDGVFNAINVKWTPGKGYIDVPHGSSYVQVVQFRRHGCPNSFSILTYSQSTDPTSPYYSDQTRMFADKRWSPMRFCASQLRKDPALRVQKLRVKRGG